MGTCGQGVAIMLEEIFQGIVDTMVDGMMMVMSGEWYSINGLLIIFVIGVFLAALRVSLKGRGG